MVLREKPVLLELVGNIMKTIIITLMASTIFLATITTAQAGEVIPLLEIILNKATNELNIIDTIRD